MPGTLKLNSGGAGNLILTPSGSVGSDVTLTLPASTATLLTNKTAGTVLQVVSTLTQKTSGFTTTSTSLTATGFSQTITPSSASNKILIIFSTTWQNTNSSTVGMGIGATIYRSGTNLATGTAPSVLAALQTNSTSANISTPLVMQAIDSPGTTSAVTYEVYGVSQGSPTTCSIAGSYSLMGSGAYTFTLIEIAA